MRFSIRCLVFDSKMMSQIYQYLNTTRVMERGHSVLSIQLDANTLGLRRWLIQALKYLCQDLSSNSREHMK